MKNPNRGGVRRYYLVTLRKVAKLTQAELAYLAGVSQPEVSRLERVPSDPAKVHPHTVRALASALGVPPVSLCFGPNPHARGQSARQRQRRDRKLGGLLLALARMDGDPRAVAGIALLLTIANRRPPRRPPAVLKTWRVAWVIAQGGTPPPAQEESLTASYLGSLAAAAGVTRTEWAQRCGISPAALADLINRRQDVDRTVQLLAPALGVQRAQFRAVYTALSRCEEERARSFRTIKKHRDTKAGQMYARGPNGEMAEVPDYLEPDIVICRRLADYPGQQAPQGAALGSCAKCGAPICFNPLKFPDKPHVCLQCADFQPLPMED